MTDFEDAGLYIPLYYTLASVLNYLKGKDLSPERFSFAEDFFGPTPEEWLAQLAERTPEAEPLVQIESMADALEPCSDCGSNHHKSCDVHIDMHSEEYPEYSIQNQKPLDEDDADVAPIA